MNLNSVVVAALLLGSGLAVAALLLSSGGDDGALPRLAPELASVDTVIDGAAAGLSPDGSLVFVKRPLSGGLRSLCLVETSDGGERFCVPETAMRLDWVWWSPDSAAAVVAGTVAAPDGLNVIQRLALMDISSGAMAPLSRDGQASAFATFTPSGERIVFQSWDHHEADGISLALYDIAAAAVVETLPLPPGGPDRGGDTRALSTPLMVDEASVLFGIDHQVLRADFDAGEVTVVFDHTDSYQPEETDYLRFPAHTLQPTAILNDGRVLLSDTNTSPVLTMTGGRAGWSSGFHIADLEAGSLVPVFADSPDIDPWFGPLAVLPMGGTQLVVGWFDNSTITERDLPTLTYSLIDLEKDTLPVNPSELPVLWIGEESFLADRISEQGTTTHQRNDRDGSTTELLRFVTE